MASPEPKRQKTSAPLIGTHNGHFHADEALAVYLLRLLPTYTGSPLIRTRDPALLSTCHTVVDVGGEYNPSTQRFDHHQREFKTVFPGHTTKLSSAGLVYLHYGRAIISQHTSQPTDSPDVSLLYEKLYTDFIEPFDANDNGVPEYDPSVLASSNIKPRFVNRGFSLAAAVNRFNYAYPVPGLPEPEATDDAALDAQAAEDARFAHASTFVGTQFALELADKVAAWLPARAAVSAAFEDRTTHHPSGAIMVLKEGSPWADHLYSLEEAAAVKGQVLYVLFPEGAGPGSKWRIRAVGVEGEAFSNRKDLPDAWKGLRDEELSKVAGVPGAVFVHASGFIGGNASFEGALEMARKAVEI
ncbi:metal-dependent protein hydrolase [Trichodelitschia bisporula]|uniref:Metal-dependent protein hydrolase n=1 Tax=Trichodelitschia bisporula TaxID=703511 RepID=A0A6G1HTK7_9PEZI|nr:metal-dependent protein hydrolase [Trichodelitschia bisporula]